MSLSLVGLVLNICSFKIWSVKLVWWSIWLSVVWGGDYWLLSFHTRIKLTICIGWWASLATW